ncbi:MAG: hypothetical protein KJS77_07325, partial [Planctomycetes bacterium]|nr:hypothetical protein [Planctomycetota bacterium]
MMVRTVTPPPFIAALGDLCGAPKIQINGPVAEVIPSTLFPQHEDRLVALHHESLDVVKPGLQKVGDLMSRRVSDADLNDLWGMASHQSPGQKVVVFR